MNDVPGYEVVRVFGEVAGLTVHNLVPPAADRLIQPAQPDRDDGRSTPAQLAAIECRIPLREVAEPREQADAIR